MIEYTITGQGTINGLVQQTMYTEAPDKLVRIWMAGNDTASYLVTNPLAGDGVGTVPITVNGQTEFYVPPEGRWSDPIDLSTLTAGQIDFLATVKGIAPLMEPTGGGSEAPGVITADQWDLSYLESEDCSSAVSWTVYEIGGSSFSVTGNQFKCEMPNTDGAIYIQQVLSAPPTQFIIDIKFRHVTYAAQGLGIYYIDENWRLVAQFRYYDYFGTKYLRSYITNSSGIGQLVNTSPYSEQEVTYRFVVDRSGGDAAAICTLCKLSGSVFEVLGTYDCDYVTDHGGYDTGTFYLQAATPISGM